MSPIFHLGFLCTAELVLAGSDSQGLRRDTTGTEELFLVQWEDEADSLPSVAGALLVWPLAQLYTGARLFGLMRNFMFFDACRKKMSPPSAITRVGGNMRWEPRRPKTLWAEPVRSTEHIRATPLAGGASRLGSS